MFIVAIVITLNRGVAYGYAEYFQVTPTREDISEAMRIETVPASLGSFCGYRVRAYVIDSVGYIYGATNEGLLIVAPESARKKKYGWSVVLLYPFLKGASAVQSFFGSDTLGKLIKGKDGCVLMDGKDGLPEERLSWIAKDNEGELLLGSAHGLILFSQGQFSRFSGRRWLHDDAVERAWFSKENLFAETGGRISKIARFNLSLQVKEEWYANMMRKHVRYGFAASLDHGNLTVRDNDGLWTAMYLASQAFKFRVTGSIAAHMEARASLDALFFLDRVTGVSGYFARAVAKRSEPIPKIWDGDWHDSPIYPGWRFEGDTSYDELVGHFFAYAIYYDFAADQGEKEEIRFFVNAIIDRLLRYHFSLVDGRGDVDAQKHGTHADPEETFTHVYGFLGRGPLSLGTLGIVKIAAHITARSDLATIYQQLLSEYRYALNVYNARIGLRANYSREELAFLSYYNLIRLEENPDVRAFYMLSIKRYWQEVRSERNPLWNFIYGAISGNECDLDEAREALEEIPLDTREWSIENSSRADIIRWGNDDKEGMLKNGTAISPRERQTMKWNGNPFQLDAGGDGKYEIDPSFWLLPYWMGMYYHLL